MLKKVEDAYLQLNKFSQRLMLWGEVLCFVLTIVALFFSIKWRVTDDYSCRILSMQIVDTVSRLLSQIFLYAVFIDLYTKRFMN